MKAKITKRFVSSFCICLFVLLSCNPSEPIRENQINISKIRDTSQVYTLGNCTFTGEHAKVEFDRTEKIAKRFSMMGMCHQCLLNNDTVISISKQNHSNFFTTHTIEINSENIVVKINTLPKIGLDERSYSSDKNAVLFYTDGVVIANRTDFMKELNRIGILSMTPKGGACMGSGCLIVRVKKANEILYFEDILINDTAFQNACKAIEVLVEQEMGEAGIFPREG